MLELCHSLIDAGADIDAGTSSGQGDALGETPLHYAIYACADHPEREQVALALIDRGADVNDVGQRAASRGVRYTPLDLARLFGAPKVEKRLIELGAAPGSLGQRRRLIEKTPLPDGRFACKWRTEPLGRFVSSEIIERNSGRVAILECVEADITQLNVHVIVNAANASLLGGGGVDGAIHGAAGPELLEACRELPEKRPGVRCEPGEAVMTPGFDLAAQAVVHAVGPVWEGGDFGEAETLARCYRRCLAATREGFALPNQGYPQIAFPSISTGAYGFPPEEAAEIAVETLRDELRRSTTPQIITLCCYDEESAEIVAEAMR